ncbi:MAG: GDP-fucose synthetase [Omnitrophica bacterium RIFCSPLOWO2_12_FULL_44_17]|uniref:GDP-L-fucose synthase n=1 Tax=Candidatus Danuiimicrobium aquiferis TaxID=1801832 RepID=A0A1G1KQ55_9BACT|nr:MAG: GDP-fucose synthetase [Omnitrophica bacterium RIFCSPHIGHO2_02_FULL_45_28]OGW92542.1 MAG: GDP-fucose synthetase [Omnitrophica bacterium RIFCSPHIGHO2_12_FULL_44_12]OGW95053.1 MAG: GDP-fucose synthetase [Omnitrophica bacterium RIFCSPLOWO2_12_FULL_44_17]OGX02973.1 MAG: GDP-fucose synthetase [Omnitrophica bacterium RIFCSPLOWO2_02_FULL_44_11]
MNKNARIYIAGHQGFIGSAIARRLKSAGFRNLILRSHGELDLTDRSQTEIFFRKEKPEYVFLAAAKVGGIHANATYPAEFIYQNLMIQTNVIDLSYRYGIKKLLFLASSCVYPKICKQPMKENYLLTGAIEPTNEPFAVAKLAGIKMCQTYHRQYHTNFISVIPANVYGVNDHTGKDAHVVSSLMMKFLRAKSNGEKEVTVWGSGKPKREFLYVDDLAEACVFLMDQYNSSDVINVGAGKETSVRQLAAELKRITGFHGKIIFDTKKPDGNMRRFLDSGKIHALGWKAKTKLNDGLRRIYLWFKQNDKDMA